jgi:hypothetical protein
MPANGASVGVARDSQAAARGGSETLTGTAPRVMATLRSQAISLLRLDGHANNAARLRAGQCKGLSGTSWGER